MPCQLGQVGVDDLILGAVGVGSTNVKPRPVADGLDDPDVVPAVVVAAFTFGDAVGDVGGLHVDRVPLAVGRTEIGGRRNPDQPVHGTDKQGVLETEEHTLKTANNWEIVVPFLSVGVVAYLTFSIFYTVKIEKIDQSSATFEGR